MTDSILKTQNAYMREWLEEKRGPFLNRIIQEKAYGNSTGVCHNCSVGRAVWRCKDCTDRQPLCVYCCRNEHRKVPFHRVEKWNGRHYQCGALWQVGVKIYTGHNGQPCPLTNAVPPPANHTAIKSRSQPVQFEDSVGTNSFSSAVAAAEMEAGQLQADADKLAAEEETRPPNVTQATSDIPIIRDDDEDDNWEDEDERPTAGHVPRFLPRPPPHDGAGHEFLTIVHSNGFHDLPVVWCSCPGHTYDRDLQLIDLRLYPASYDKIKTVFTFDCLNQQRYQSLESKISLGQYHQYLRRQTCSEYPDASPDRYAELRRVTWQWRNLKYRKWFWLLDNKQAGRGEMALFCAPCPQPGVNLPKGWEDDFAKNP